ncbi:MAG: flagellar hook-basal body complex protein FliE [Desulfobacterales bacterium]|jgi:flagellar hook-basal body complex protein FliE|nr:flagellar hook-basal body complex protein FliE [Desulfobacterales bacterium]
MNGPSIEGIAPLQPVEIAPKAKPEAGGFADALKSAVGEVNHLQHLADNAVTDVAKGNLGIHEGMMALAEADLSLRLLIQVRNKVMDAYREISRMS